jgi:predicted metal-dependent enzyme (double-stranded beta helix superfamily)
VLLHAPRRTAAPTPLTLPDLSALTRSVAAQVRTGAHDVVLDPHRRWYRRLHADPYVDVWLISWVAEQATELHDHAGSIGALTVVSGELLEKRWAPADLQIRRAVDGSVPGLRARRLRAGRGASFALGHVHDVVNTRPEHAVSVHAYSPPLTAMSYYAVDAGGALRRTRSVLTDGGSA